MVKQIKRFTSKKSKKAPSLGVVHVKSTFNNTIVNITDKQGNTLFGLLQVVVVLKAQKKEHHLRLSQLQKKLVHCI